ncbi:hypothetical protein GCM10007916_13580 [Psychromonas marina]|uniref:Aromatic amino acid beta-eliminating lyase/threonine aldolase domain-containing protein n=1 Tax=Psychromonas marina TaxID=88364 RepID=A0ABQ6DYP8_9GAMM|nr:beta-eliminating lyase-related protein [Psychromonas marina]GLS90291.1 hypothetical protein GCM10007916_13580 [Psychromonas marina]
MIDEILMGHPLMAKCTKFVTRHKPLTHRQWLAAMQQAPQLDLALDIYGEGPTIDILEDKMAKLLGKEKAIFVHKGMVGQHSVLLQHAKASGKSKIAIHPQSHIHHDESMAYQELLGLEGVMFGKNGCAIEEDDINGLPADLALISVELPIRRAGYRLPEWETLMHLKLHCETNAIPLHIDGARLFECADYWQKSYAEVAALADSVYVSLYKTLGAAAGGIIAGDKAFIEQLLPWRSRLGGNILTVFPYVLSALVGIEKYLPRVSEFNQRALTLSQLIKDKLGDCAIPNKVQCNGFVVELPITPSQLKEKALSVAENERIWLFDRIIATENNTSHFEIQIGDAMDDWSDQAYVNKLASLL